jgi:putative holliday junction resolvase
MTSNDRQYLGVDWGEKRIGLALADGETKMALPLGTVSNLKELLKVIEEENITSIIIGSPQKMSGEKVDSVRFLQFLKDLKKQSEIEVIEVDERLSSKAADALFGGKKDKAKRDEIAATLILQTYLDLL